MSLEDYVWRQFYNKLQALRDAWPHTAFFDRFGQMTFTTLAPKSVYF